MRISIGATALILSLAGCDLDVARTFQGHQGSDPLATSDAGPPDAPDFGASDAALPEDCPPGHPFPDLPEPAVPDPIFPEPVERCGGYEGALPCDPRSPRRPPRSEGRETLPAPPRPADPYQ